VESVLGMVVHVQRGPGLTSCQGSERFVEGCAKEMVKMHDVSRRVDQD